MEKEPKHGDWRDNPMLVKAVSLANVLDGLDLPKGTKLRGTRGGIEITEPGKEPYVLTDSDEAD